ncbi:MAG: hypothetical protein JWM99_255 [Verrucomicrobiales bacterium]|nr:hypothetical protein [Verrucomicrobiales bacterium]
MRTAFKEWAIVVDALGRGEQIIILRKGGISEGRGGFKMEHSEFLLLPSLFHQQRESVVPSAQVRYDLIAPTLPKDDEIRIEFFAKVAEWKKLESLSDARALLGQHIWKEQVIEERFEWGGEHAIFAIAVRVFRLPKPFKGPMLPQYGGCKSWIELGTEIESTGGVPVLTDAEFKRKLSALQILTVPGPMESQLQPK